MGHINTSLHHRRAFLLVFLCCTIAATTAFTAPITQSIKTDHFGYRPGDLKIAVFSANPGSSVEVRNTSDAVVFAIPANGGSITSKGGDGAPSGDTIWWVDFSAFTTPGTYRLYSPALGSQSYDFEIRADVYNAAMRAALKTFYYQRCNTPKTAANAGNWADTSACHMSDVSTGPASGHTNFGQLNLTGGWHDAGDYNKYVWKAASTAILFMLRAYEDNPVLFLDGDLNIPESGNGIPDILDEIKWELDWMLRMQLSNGAVLYQMHVNGFASNAPPSADTNVRFYQDPNMESASVLAGSAAYASRVFASVGMTTYAATLKTAAVNAWSWLQSQSDSAAADVREAKVWAAAELFRTDATIISARTYVDNFYPSSWAGRFYNVARYDTHAAVTYIQTPGASAAVVTNMRASIRDQVNYLFSNNDLYRNGMPSWSYHWGSNTPRAAQGLFLLKAAQLNETGSYTAEQCIQHAQDMLHFFHGQNALNMVYLSNMAALGGEHSSFQFYHAWFGDSANSYSRTHFMGKPASVSEPDYPYYKGTDNHGVSDNKSSTLGPAPAFVPGGPNASYSGTAAPPGNATYYNRFYRDWADQTVWTAMTWEITENSIGYQGPYVALAAYFSAAGTPPPPPPDPVPNAPTNLSASPASATQINLLWSDNANDEQGFTIERSTNNVSFTQIATVGANVQSFNNTGLTSGTTYFYRVRAYNTAGNSTYTNVASATTPHSPPAAPSALSAVAQKKRKIQLNWTDNSGNETGFRIERSTNQVNWTQIASVGANVRSYSNSNLTVGTIYYYRVRAYNAAGNSNYSNIASARAIR